MKKIIISGASGFIGQNLVAHYLSKGYYVVGIGREGETVPIKNENFVFYEANFENYKKLPQIIKLREFETFIHLAWAGYGKQTNDYNVQVMNILYTCDAVHVASELGCKKFIFADSSHEYQKNYYKNNKELQPDFCSIYGAAKYSASRFCRVMTHNLGMNFNGVLFTNVFGVGDASMRSANTFVLKLLDHEDLNLISGDHLYDWTYIDDVVSGIWFVDTKGTNNVVYYVGNNELKTFKQIITELRDIISPESSLFFGAYDDSSFIDYSEINVGRLSKDTDYLPSTEFADGVRKLVEWLKKRQQEMK